MRKCSVEGCDAKHKAKGLCSKHYTSSPENKIREARRRATTEYQQYQATYRKDHREKAAATTAAWRQEHPGYGAKYMLTYYPANKDKWYSYNRARYLANPEAVNAGIARRRVKAKQGMSKQDIAKSVQYRKMIKDDPCYYCGQITDNMQDEHVYPLSRGGTDHWFNLVRACSGCNGKKSAKTGAEFEATL